MVRSTWPFEVGRRGRSTTARVLEGPEESADLGVEPGPSILARGHDTGIVVEDERLGHTAEPLEAAGQGGPQVPDRAPEGEDGGMGTRPGQRGHEAEGLLGQVPTDGDVPAGVPPVDLADLAGPIARALEGPRREEARTHRARWSFRMLMPPRIAERTQVLPDDGGGRLRVRVEHRRDGVGEGIELRALRGPGVARWLVELEQPGHGVATHAEPTGDGRLRQPLPIEEPMDLGPVFH